VITGRGGVPQNPAQRVGAEHAWKDLRNLASLNNTATSATRNLTETAIAPVLKPSLVEATSWQRNLQTGKVELTAARPALSNTIATCTATPKS
jgi:large exoprotein involved in heme utilization and adhesion